MKILKISGSTISQPQINAYASVGMELRSYKLSGIKFLAALQVSKILDRENYDIIEVDSLQNCIIAIDANKLAKAKPKIVINLSPNSIPPRTIPSDIITNTDLIIYPGIFSQNIFYQAGGDKFKNTAVIQPTLFIDDAKLKEKQNITKTGEITIVKVDKIADTDRLRKTIEGFEKLCETVTDAQLIICGVGRPADVMPIVRKSRHTNCANRITWTGEDYNLPDIMSRATICVASARDITGEESYLCANGINIIEPEEIANIPNINKLKNSENNKYSQCFHVEQLISIYKTLLKNS